MKLSKLNVLAIGCVTLIGAIAIQSCGKDKNPPAPSGPSVTSVTSGGSDTVGKAYALTITGANLSGATVTTTAAGVTLTGIAATSTSITGTITIASTATPGPVTLTITTSAGSTTTTVTVVAVPLIGGFASSDSVAAASLIAYWPFDGNANETKGGLTPTVVGTPTYAAGIRGQAYQGAAGAYATYTPGAAFTTLPSYSVSFWYNIPTTGANFSSTTGQDTLTQGVLFLYGTDDFLLANEIEPWRGDSIRVHAGFKDFASPAYQGFVPETFDTMARSKWVHFVVTYNGGTSSYIVYQDGMVTNANTAFSPNTPSGEPYPFPGYYNSPNILYTDGSKTTLLGNLGWAAEVPSKLIVGSWPDGLFGQSAVNNTFRGQLDEMRVYNKAISQMEVTGLYLNGKAGR